MKLVSAFDAFLVDVVNLNDTRIDQLDSSFEAIKRFIRVSAYTPKRISFFKHGSWSHKTIIRPVDGRAFDADVILFVKPVEGWDAAQYVDELARVFRDSPTYQDKVRVYSHCVTIEYAGVRKMDIAPCVANRVSDGSLEVCNRNSNIFQVTEPQNYTNWLNKRNSQSGKNSLRKVTRLIKYLRDIKTTFTCPSFLLTTLLGKQVFDGDKDGTEFADVPTALKTLISRLDDWLQANESVPYVANPALNSEDQAIGWTDTQYANFRTQINRYRTWIEDAFDETGVQESLDKWKRVFGDDFDLLRKTQAMVAPATQGASLDDVDQARVKGITKVSPLVLSPRWRKEPTWQQDLVQSKVTVSAKLISFDHDRKMRVTSGMPVEPNQWIRFTARLGGVDPGPSHRTEWRVTNTGSVASLNKQLRGGFESSDSPHSRQEQLEFRGVHMVEAFVIRLSDERVVGFSQPFYVVIE